ncbi:glycoside hydrolase family 130 protein [Sphingomonas sp. MMS24-J13]|uniref:glycoside hydrolase family 130 protein n=1 Tax=Sphingomonas sp. MMS24-J13 TaxID=3238686 RepID=UPI00384B68E8
MSEIPIVTWLSEVVRPQPSRVVLRPFTPADDPTADAPGGRGRTGRVIDRVLAIGPADLKTELDDVLASLRDRHDDIEPVLLRRFREVVPPSFVGPTISHEGSLLIGAYFSEEYSFEAAALFNPSIVPHPDQSGVQPGAVRFVMSLRGVGEGHISSITFRTGTFDGRSLVIDPPLAHAISPSIEEIPGGAEDDPGVRLFCGAGRDLSAIVIFPVTLRQRHGIEDLRLTRFTEDDGRHSYIGTYTAFSGEAVREELLRTEDFTSFELSAMRGAVAGTKGMALFPRRIGGHFAMLARQDHESIWFLRSNDLYEWGDGRKIVSPRFPWELIQIGNCGAPVEIDEGWLVLIHGVGPVRNYSLGACLLDKNDPTRLLARTTEPLIGSNPTDRDGYVPNVVYSCGAMLHGRTLLLPYGVADSFTAFATISVDALLRAMR